MSRNRTVIPRPVQQHKTDQPATYPHRHLHHRPEHKGPVKHPDIRIHIHIQRDKVTVALDSSGHSLHRRGYRTATNNAPLSEVLAAGKGKVNEKGDVSPLDVKVGDKVLFGKYAGTEVKVEGEELLVMREEDIMGVIEG